MADSENECKVYVGSLKFETDDERLKDYFSTIGDVVKGKLTLFWMSLSFFFYI